VTLADPNADTAAFAMAMSAVILTATITITPKAGFALSGVAANFFTVSGEASVTLTLA